MCLVFPLHIYVFTYRGFFYLHLGPAVVSLCLSVSLGAQSNDVSTSPRDSGRMCEGRQFA